MARYTFELRELISTFGRDEVKNWFKDYDLSDYLTPEEIAVINEKGVWDKDQLAERIVTHFYLREVGQETTGAFILMAKDLMQELMETYAPLIYSASIKFDPMTGVSVTDTFSRDFSNSGNRTDNNSSNGSGLTIESDTPQGQINKNDILAGRYASRTNANENEEITNNVSNTSDSGNEQSSRTTTGRNESAQRLINEYRGIIRALNTEIVYQLEPLFMGIY